MTFKAFVVEDHIAIRDSLVETLAELGGVTTVGTAASEQEAIAWLADGDHEWDIAIVDLILEPGGSGFGVLQACRRRSPTQKVVVLTGAANDDVRSRCEALGSDRVFDKAIETDALLDYCLDLAAQAGRR